MSCVRKIQSPRQCRHVERSTYKRITVKILVFPQQFQLRNIEYSVTFKRDYKRMLRWGVKIKRLDAVLGFLVRDTPLPERVSSKDMSGSARTPCVC